MLGLGMLIESMGSLMLRAAFIVISYQFMTWLHTNEWPYLPVQRLWGSRPFSIAWVAVDRIAQSVARAPLIEVLVLLGAFFVYAGFSIGKTAGKRAGY